MQLRGSHLVSLAILGGIGGWMLTGDLIRGGQADPNAETIAEREAKRTTKAFRVRVTTVEPTERLATLEVRGRTQANLSVAVRAETGGTVETRAFSKGDKVKVGDLICVLDEGVRGTSMAQAEASLAQAEADYEANQKLLERGFTSKSRVRQLKAAMDAAKAQLAAAQQELERVEVRATASGILQDPLAEVGDTVTPNGVCATILDTDPMKFTGQVSEVDIANIKIGMEANVELITGQTVSGEISYIAPVADANTRTFNVEIKIPNANGLIRDGLTASAKIPLAPQPAYKIESSWLTLADDGQIGVRGVDSANTVLFLPVKILAEDTDGMWVTGLKPDVPIITLGQNYVAAGETVDPVTAEQMKALEKAKETKEAEANS